MIFSVRFLLVSLWDNSIASTGNTMTVDPPTVNTPTEKWGRGVMTTEVKSYIELRKMGSVVEKGRSRS